MTKLPRTSISAPQAGFTMIEAMVAIVVLCFGLLALAGFQVRVLASSASASNKSQAILLTSDIADRIRANPIAGVPSASPYVTDWSAAAGTPATDCATATCNKVQLAVYDLWVWKTAAANALPGGVANIAADAGNGGSLFVHIAWSEPGQTDFIAPPAGWGCPADKSACQEIAVATRQP